MPGGVVVNELVLSLFPGIGLLDRAFEDRPKAPASDDETDEGDETDEEPEAE